VRPASDYTRFQSDNLQTRVTHVIVIRHQSALADVKETVKMRITLDGRLFDVRAVKNMDDSLKDYGKAYQVIMADEAGPDV
jgi:SPP1 family predicted phage head-tail adaptor